MLGGFSNEAGPVEKSGLIAAAIFYLLLVAIIGSILHYRKIDVFQFLGVARLNIVKTIGLGLLYVAAAYPLVQLASSLAQKGDAQQIVDYFVTATKSVDYWAVILTFIMGVIIAPFAEEFIFRGYLYPIFKRHLGIEAGIVLNAALFAGIHGNLTALPSLFTLACCLTIAYEVTGTILVPMLMHALFNLSTLTTIIYLMNKT